MRNVLVLLLMLLALLSVPAVGQDEEDDPLPPPRRHGQAKIGGAGGFTQHLLFLNLDPINQFLRNSNAAEFDKGPMVMLGGQGYGYILVLANVRVGGMWGSGTMKSKALQGLTRRDVELSAGYGGVTLDYVLPVIPRVDLTFGILLGGGGASVKMTRDEGLPKTWDGIWTEFGSSLPAQEYSRTLSGSFFAYQPTVNVEVAVLRWFGLRLGVSYNGMAGNNWKLDEKYDVVGVPDGISGKGWMVNGGVFLGTFLF